MSKFMVLDRPFMFPGKSICCGTINGPVIDFGGMADFEGRDGAIYFCVNCLVEAALKTGLVIKPENHQIVPVGVPSELADINERLRDIFTSGLRLLGDAGGIISALPHVEDSDNSESDVANSGQDQLGTAENSDQLVIDENTFRVSSGASDDKRDEDLAEFSL